MGPLRYIFIGQLRCTFLCQQNPFQFGLSFAKSGLLFATSLTHGWTNTDQAYFRLQIDGEGIPI